jgi:succinyl-CoA synthetase beta subunit
MKIHEYQAKEIFKKYGIPIPECEVARTPGEAKSIASRFGKPVVIKSQVLVGGRGKAGGIKFAKTPGEAETVAGKILGMEIKGMKVLQVLVAESVDIKSEAYVGVIPDRNSKSPVIMVSSEGGIDIEDVAKKTPEKIHKLMVDPTDGLLPHQARELCFKLYDAPKIAIKASSILLKLYRAFIESDSSLAEINPLVLTPDDELWAIDAKMNIDDNGLFKHKEIASMRDLAYESPQETEAREAGLAFHQFEGNIGNVVNGAGLAMATMDLIKEVDGEPANFLDIGGSSSPEKVTNALRILLSDPNVKVVYFNIFGGITRCDDVARGIIEGLQKLDVTVPIVIRLTGTNEEEAYKILEKTNLIPASSMLEGAKKAVELASRN